MASPPSFQTRLKLSANSLLRLFNLKLETLTVDNLEKDRLNALKDAGHFNRKIFPVPETFAASRPEEILSLVRNHENRFLDLRKGINNQTGFTFDNIYFTSPDAEVLYALLRHYKPSSFVEIGSGHSTRMARQAIIDEGLDTRIISIDPQPRTEIRGLIDEHHPSNAEHFDFTEVLKQFKPDDFFFLDSSHTIKANSDVVFVLLNVLPQLPRGAVIHIHDIFLPYEYPEYWLLKRGWTWNEQYLVQAILQYGNGFEVLWAGHYLEKTFPQFNGYFPRSNGKEACSLWIRKVI